MPDLKLVKAEGIFKLMERIFNTPSETIDAKDIFWRKIKSISNKDMKSFIVFVRPLVENKEDFHRNGTVFELRFEAIIKDVFGIIFRLYAKRFKFVSIVFFKNRNPVGSFKLSPSFGFGVSKTDTTVRF